MNQVCIVGRITKEPELRKTQGGTSVVTFTLAVNRTYKDENGETPSDFINCVAWRNQAEFIGQWIKKGFLLGLNGSLQTRTYQDNGKTIYVTEVIVDSIENFTPKEQEDNPRRKNEPPKSDGLPF